jgi:hypothetical protein
MNAYKAIDLMKAQLDSDDEHTRMIGAKRIRNGGIVYKLNSTIAAQWVQQ